MDEFKRYLLKYNIAIKTATDVVYACVLTRQRELWGGNYPRGAMSDTDIDIIIDLVKYAATHMQPDDNRDTELRTLLSSDELLKGFVGKLVMLENAIWNRHIALRNTYAQMSKY